MSRPATSLNPYVMMVTQHQQLLDVQTEQTFSQPLCDDGNPAPTTAGCPDEQTFSQPLCDDGNPAPTTAGCPDEPTFSQPLCDDGNPAPTTAGCPDEQTFSQPLCDDGNPAPTTAGCPDEQTFSQPLCDDGNPAPTTAGCPDEQTFSQPLCDDGNPAPDSRGCQEVGQEPTCDESIGQREQSPGVCVSDRLPPTCPEEFPTHQGPNCLGPVPAEGCPEDGREVGPANNRQCQVDRSLANVHRLLEILRVHQVRVLMMLAHVSQVIATILPRSLALVLNLHYVMMVTQHQQLLDVQTSDILSTLM